jgi:hypothetical protein
MTKAEAHITTALRRLEMMQWFLRQKKLSKEHVHMYFDLLTNDIAQIQNELLSDDQYTACVARGLAKVNHKREYKYTTTNDKDGEVYYDVNALLPLRTMKENVVFARGYE